MKVRDLRRRAFSLFTHHEARPKPDAADVAARSPVLYVLVGSTVVHTTEATQAVTVD